MLRLWPERLVASAFPESGWLLRTGGKLISQYADGSPPMQSLVDRLDLLLRVPVWSRKPDIELLVSDSQARIVHLPWQDSLRNNEQERGYARACFDQAGLGVDDDWLVQASFRHYRGGGIGYALPRALVAEVKTALYERGLRLRAMLPLSAAAYWRNRTGARGQRSALVLEEHRRVSALLFEGRQCVGIHVQPVGDVPADAWRRLLCSVEATYPGVTRVQCWSVHEQGAIDVEAVRTRLPQAHIVTLATASWN